MVSLHHNGLNGILADEMVSFFAGVSNEICQHFHVRALVKPCKPFLFSHTSNTTEVSQDLISSSFPSQLSRTGPVNLKNGLLISMW